jgi:predicted metalloprotease
MADEHSSRPDPEPPPIPSADGSPTPPPRRTTLIVAAVAGVIVLALVIVGATLALAPRPAVEPAPTPTPAPGTTGPTDETIPRAGPTTPVSSVFPTYNGNGPDDNVLYNISWPHDVATPTCPDLDTYRPSADADATKTAIKGILDCLRRINEPRLAEYEIAIGMPEVVFYADTISTGCGSSITADSIGDFCTRDGKLYFSLTALTSTPLTANPLSLYWIAAHEYAHYIQHETAILQSDADSAADSRRIELQANCVAGMFFNGAWSRMGASDAMLTQTRTMFEKVYADEAPGHGTHGTPASTITWFDKGFAAKGTSHYAACNTFVAGLPQIR